MCSGHLADREPADFREGIALQATDDLLDQLANTLAFAPGFGQLIAKVGEC